MIANFLFYLAAGRLIVWLLQTNGLTRPLWNWKPVLRELRDCDLCLGFWVYLALAYFAGVRLDLWSEWLDLLIIAAISAFGMHLIRLGWQARFGLTVID